MYYQGLLNRFGLHKKLRKHKGCVNTVSFNADGDILVSGSDDRQVILWDWETGTVKLSFDSGHRSNIFQAKFMPFSDDRSIVTSASDGQVHPLFLKVHVQILFLPALQNDNDISGKIYTLRKDLAYVELACLSYFCEISSAFILNL